MTDTEKEFGANLKFGTVSASRPGFARVRLPDFDNMRTMWLPIAYPKTQDDQSCWTYDIGEQVAVILDPRGEDGVILGAVYSNADKPPISDPNKFSIRFKDGALLEYDRGSHVLTATGVEKVIVQASTKVTIDCPDTEVTGNLLVKGMLTYQGGMAGSGGDGGTAAYVRGNIRVEGSVTATGSIMDSGGNSNHHSH